MSASAEELVRRVCDGWNEFAMEDFREIFAEDCTYQNIPIPGIHHGPDAIFEVLGAIGAGYEIKLRIDNLVTSPTLVMAERTEHFTRQDGTGSFELQAVGVFEVRDGRIQSWRDYFHFDPTLWGVEQA
ncbi:nuclear transport factor 2 family protein [Myxococcota bacterium]|nr:nuclear transport factor 2 family protein [Myxococcota bacterium]